MKRLKDLLEVLVEVPLPGVGLFPRGAPPLLRLLLLLLIGCASPPLPDIGTFPFNKNNKNISSKKKCKTFPFNKKRSFFFKHFLFLKKNKKAYISFA